MTKTGGTLTAYHFGSRAVARTDGQNTQCKHRWREFQAFKYFHEITTAEECYFTAGDTQTDPTPSFPLHSVHPESNG